MKKKNSFILTLLIFAAAATALPHNNAQAASKLSFVVVYPGSDTASAEGKKMITEFVSTLAGITGISRSRLKGEFFTNPALAEQYIRTNPDCFIMGSMGFFLKNRTSYNLQPLAKISMQGATTEEYRLLVKKGTFPSISAMKGKTIGGNILKENSRFISNIVFNSQLNAASHFILNKNLSTLRAIRNTSRGSLDGVVVDAIEYTMIQSSIKENNSMAPLFKKLHTVYTSRSYPALGFMMRDTAQTRAYRARIMNTMSSICTLSQGREVCKNFGINGFIPVRSGEMNNAISNYSAR